MYAQQDLWLSAVQDQLCKNPYLVQVPLMVVVIVAVIVNAGETGSYENLETVTTIYVLPLSAEHCICINQGLKLTFPTASSYIKFPLGQVYSPLALEEE